MRLVLSNSVQINWEGEDTEEAGKRKFTHDCRKGQQGCTDDTGPDVREDDRQEGAPPATTQAICRLGQHSGVDRTQTVVDRAIYTGQGDDHVTASQQR